MKDTREVYWKWTWAFRDTTALCIVLQTVLTLSLSQRKELLGLARTQSPVVAGSYLESTLAHLHDNVLVPSSINRRLVDVRYISMPFRDLIANYQDALLHPIPCSIIALATRISPNTTSEEYDAILRTSVHKELSSAIDRFHGATLDFRCIMSSDLQDREIPFSDRLAPDPEVASDTYQILCCLRQELSNMLIFPSFGRKTVGSTVASNFWTEYYRSGSTFKHDGRFEPSSQVTCGDCLKLYAETGGCVDGPVEMRSVWKYNQIGPRVYYARGGSVIPVSQYLQPVINRIIDAFPETHRKNRFSPPKDPLDPDDVEVIYDYTSFTSTLDDVVEFVRHLSSFFRGVFVTLVDVRLGLQRVDLGDLFAAYNKQCNDYADFDPSRVLPPSHEGYPVLQHTCGMLGVEGNIFLATLLHGIHLRFVSGLRRSRCVGDDARLHHKTIDGQLTVDERTHLGWVLSGIGETNDEKLGVFEADVDPVMQAFRYVKRPIRRDHDLMIEGLLFDIPSLIPLFRLSDPYHTVLPSSSPTCRLAFRSIIRLLRILKLHNLTLESDDCVSMLAHHVRHLLQEVRDQDPTAQQAPLARSGLRIGYGLPPVTEWGKVEYEEWVLGSLGYDETIRFLKRGGGDDNAGVCDGRVGSTMIREVSAGRSFLVKMGYLEKEELFDDVSISSIGMDEMKEYLDGQYRAVCLYTVIEEIPSWYSQIPRTI